MRFLAFLRCLRWGHSPAFTKDTNRWRMRSFVTCTQCGKVYDHKWEARSGE